MSYRIVTHSNCMDGFSSAFVVKKYFNTLFRTRLSQEELQKIEILGVQPQDMPEKKCLPHDLVVDLPPPEQKVFFWCDHHLTTKPQGKLPKNYFWKAEPSCAGYLLSLAEERGLVMSEELKAFKRAIGVKDNAEYTAADIKECFYPQKDYNNPSPLLKVQMINALFNTRDFNLNNEIFRTLLSKELGETPLSSPELWQLDPLMYHRAQLEGYAQWREQVDTYVVYHADIKTVVQDDRKVKFSKGIPDRFYVYLKFPQASYSVNFRVDREENTVRFGMGSNIFHKERCKINLGELCREVGKQFGASGSGGGHFTVGGVSVKKESADEALEFILRKLKKNI